MGAVPSPAPAGSRLSGVAATSAGNAWAVGCSSCSMGVGEPLILHWNGTTWTQVPSPSPADSSLDRVAATSATNAWAIGTTTNGTLILHWNGTAWTRVPSPSPGAGAFLRGVAGASANSAWAVGSVRNHASALAKTLILHWNGTAWTRVPSPSPATGGDDGLTDLAVTPSGSDWAIGYFGDCGCGPAASLIERWNGTVWKQVPTPTPGGGTDLNGVAVVSARRAWVVGATGSGDGPTKALILRWNGAAWTQVPSPRAGAYGDLTGVAVTSASNAWAVGSVYSQRKNSPDRSNYKTVILHWNGTKWA